MSISIGSLFRIAIRLVLFLSFIILAGCGEEEGQVDDTSTGEQAASITSGEALYESQCIGCHGVDGEGTSSTHVTLVGCDFCDSFEQLSKRISSTMPISDPDSCTGQCADDLAKYILNTFKKSVSNDPIKPRAWRLTVEEYQKTLQVLFNLPGNYQWLEPPLERDSTEYHTNASFLVVSDQVARYFLEQAEKLSLDLSDADISEQVSCSTNDPACLSSFAQEFSEKAFRRPVEKSESERFLALAADYSGLDRYRHVMFGILNSPYFLYRTEIGSADDIDKTEFALTDYEVASFLSYSLWGEETSPAFAHTYLLYIKYYTHILRATNTQLMNVTERRYTTLCITGSFVSKSNQK